MPHDHAIHQMIKVPCTVRHSDPGDVDDYGDHPVAVETTTNELCYPAQRSRNEDNEVEVERWVVYFRPWANVDANDVVDVHGMELEVLGPPWKVIDPLTGWLTHIEATVTRRR